MDVHSCTYAHTHAHTSQYFSVWGYQIPKILIYIYFTESQNWDDIGIWEIIGTAENIWLGGLKILPLVQTGQCSRSACQLTMRESQKQGMFKCLVILRLIVPPWGNSGKERKACQQAFFLPLPSLSVPVEKLREGTEGIEICFISPPLSLPTLSSAAQQEKACLNAFTSLHQLRTLVG